MTTSTNATLTLPPGVEHQVLVTARTSVGDGASSEPVTVTARASTRVTLSVDPATGVSGQATTVSGTVDVTDGPGGITPSGAVALLLDGTRRAVGALGAPP